MVLSSHNLPLLRGGSARSRADATLNATLIKDSSESFFTYFFHENFHENFHETVQSVSSSEESVSNTFILYIS
jgi:hypothetical protein